VLNYTNILVSSLNAVKFGGLCEDDEILAYLPMAWVGDHIFSYGESLCAGFCIFCPESADTVMNNVFEVGPTFFFAQPRIFENLMTTVMIRIEDASAIKRKLFSYFMDHAKEYALKVLEGEPVPLGARRGRRLDPYLQIYRGIGFNLKQLYGITESSVFVTIQPNGEIKSNTVGKPPYAP
jgi:long-chain acyl-CoA synthetase